MLWKKNIREMYMLGENANAVHALGSLGEQQLPS